MGIDNSGLVVYDSLKYDSEAFKNKPFRSEHFLIIFVLTRTLDLKVNLLKYGLNKNGVIIIPPSAIRQFSWENENTHFISLLFTSSFFKGVGNTRQILQCYHFLREDIASYRNMEENDQELVQKMISVITEIQDRNDRQETIRKLSRISPNQSF